jgi:hypothetical protein
VSGCRYASTRATTVAGQEPTHRQRPGGIDPNAELLSDLSYGARVGLPTVCGQKRGPVVGEGAERLTHGDQRLTRKPLSRVGFFLFAETLRAWAGSTRGRNR